MGFLSKTKIWEDSCNRPDNMDSRLNALIYKASRAFKNQTPGQLSSWFRHASFIYGNYVHQIHRLDNRCHGPDAPSLDMEIACS